MANPTTRVLAVLELLQTHGRLSGAELAARVGVDGRTLRRYIATLEALGIPVMAERGRHGGYMLAAGFKLPPMMFTPDETLAVALGLLAAPGLGPDAAPAAASALAKLERVMPAPLKQRLRAVSETATLDLAPAAGGRGALLLALAAAAQAQRRVRFSYRSDRGEDSAREVDPYGLVYRRGHWYLGGYCRLRRGLRSFRLDRMAALETLAVGFERPADFDPAEHLAAGIAALPRATPVEVLLHTDPETAMAELGLSLGVLLPVAGGVLLRTRTDLIDWFARQLARLPFEFSVREPPALRDALRACGERLLRVASSMERG